MSRTTNGIVAQVRLTKVPGAWYSGSKLHVIANLTVTLLQVWKC
jgi:hypothetical protein